MNDRVPGEPGRTIGISHESWMRAGLVLPLRHFELRPCSELAHHSVVDESGEFVGIEIVGHEIGELFMAYAHCHVVHLIPNVLRIDLSFAAATVFECLKAVVPLGIADQQALCVIHRRWIGTIDYKTISPVLDPLFDVADELQLMIAK